MRIPLKQLDLPNDATEFARGDGTWAVPSVPTVPGVLIKALDHAPASTYTTTSGTFVDVNAAVTNTFDAPVAGTYQVLFDFQRIYVTLATTPHTVEFRLVIDAGTANEQILRTHTESCDDINGFNMVVVDQVNLTLGSHTIKPQWRRAYGTGTLNVDTSSKFYVQMELVTGSGAGGSIDHAARLTSAATIAGTLSPDAFQEVSALQLSVTTAANERVLVTFSCSAYAHLGSGTAYARLKIDGVTAPGSGAYLSSARMTAQYMDTNLNFVFLTDPLTAGTHVLSFWFAKFDSVASNFQLNTHTMATARLLRGGLVPIKQDGTLVQDKPQAINAIGPGLQATNVNGQVNLSVQSAAEGMQSVSDSEAADMDLTEDYEDTSLLVEIDVAEGEYVQASFVCLLYGTGSTSRWVYTKLLSSIDGELVPEFGISTGPTAGIVMNGSWNRVLGPLSAGHHEFTVQSAQSTGTDAKLSDRWLQITRFRGGYVQSENTPILSYNTAAIINVAAAPGASSELSCQLNDGIRRRATAPLTINLATSGEGGLDTGTEAVSTWYYCYLIPKASDDTQLMALCSVTPPTTGPTGFAKWKYLGAVYNKSDGNIRPWDQTGSYFADRDGTISPALSTTTRTHYDASVYVPATASVAQIIVRSDYVAAEAELSVYVTGGTSRLGVVLATSASNRLASCGFLVPVGGSPLGFDYALSGTSAQGYFYFNGWVDKYLTQGMAQTQAKYQADTKSPKGTWATATTVNFAARPGQPSFSRLTFQDAKSRVAASSTLAWAIANGVADLGYDEAASQGNTKWLYFYAVPKSGDDNQFTIRASDNPPTTGPTGYTNWKLVWTTYIDGSGNLAKLRQEGNRFYYKDHTIANVNLGAGSDGSPVTQSAATWVPVTASAMQLWMQASASNTCAFSVFVDGETVWIASLYMVTGDSDSMTVDLPMLSSPKQFQYQRGVTIGWAEYSCLGWTDEWIDADGSSGNVLSGPSTDPDAIHDNVAGEIAALTAKATPVSGDLLLIEDSADSNNKKKVTISTLPVTDTGAIHKATAAEISALTEKTTPVSGDHLLIEDSADSNNKKRVQVGNLPAGTPDYTNADHILAGEVFT
jgi:hypothetical protein